MYIHTHIYIHVNIYRDIEIDREILYIDLCMILYIANKEPPTTEAERVPLFSTLAFPLVLGAAPNQTTHL